MGTKSDIKLESIAEKAKEFADQYGFIYVECCALKNENVEEIIQEAAISAVKSNKEGFKK